MSHTTIIPLLFGSVLISLSGAAVHAERLADQEASPVVVRESSAIKDDSRVRVLMARAGASDNVLFDPDVLTVFPDQSAVFDVWIAPIGLGSVQGVDMVIGSDSDLSMEFAYSQAWFDVANYLAPPAPLGIYPSDLFVGGFVITGVVTPIHFGTLTIFTEGLEFGDYIVMVDSIRDGKFSKLTVAEGMVTLEEPASGSVTMTFMEQPLCPKGVTSCTGAAECDDGVACTVDECVEGCCVNTPSAALCDDGQFCNGVEVCDAVNGCQPGTPPNCTDATACTLDACDEVNDVCTNQPNDAACDNGQFCDGAEVCDPVNGCQPGTPPNCTDATACTHDACDEVNDVCTNQPNNAACDNGQFCDGAEVCDPVNDCQPGTPPDCDDGVPCTVDSCDEVNDVCTNQPNDAECDNGQFCDGLETCGPVNGCQVGTAPDCDDGVPCTADSCDEINDVCTNQPNDAECDNGQFCDGAETCHAVNGCQPGTPPNCDDGVPCTTDSCDEINDVCTNQPNDAECDDGQFCDGAETCDPVNGCQTGTAPDCDDAIGCTVDTCDEVNDECAHTPDNAVCDNGQFCDGLETCDPVNGCQAGTAPDCNDVIDCTVDSCDEVNDVCTNQPNDAACDNGQFCDGAETCHATNGCQPGTPPDCNDVIDCTVDLCDEVNDECAHTPDNAVCDNGQFCDGLGTCDPVNGCQAGTPPDCDDEIPCTIDSCNEKNDVCSHQPDDSVCDNGQFCDGVEFCDLAAGCVGGVAPDCDDGVACTIDACDEAKDVCVSEPNDTACDDGAWCNGLETCHPTLGCEIGIPPDCDDGVACTVDACDEDADACVSAPDDSGCDNGLYCDGVETCDPVNGCQGGTPPVCDDAVDCTVDQCDEDSDSCVSLADDAVCDNGLFCDGVEFCDVAKGCQVGIAPDCDDGVACTADACDEDADACVSTPDDSACDNEQFCDGQETCDPINDCQAGVLPNCDDGIPCTIDSCDEVNDVCQNAPDDAACANEFFCDGVEICDPVLGCQPGSDPCGAKLQCDEDIDACVNCLLNEECDDGDFCNGVETCVDGTCVPGTPPDCDDGVDCTDDSCDEAADVCVNTANDAFCDNGAFCDGVEVCDALTGCTPGTPPDCDDGVPCTLDSCDEAKDTCTSVADDAFCDDGLFCNGAETCDALSGCQMGAAPDCDDGLACTIDECDEVIDDCDHAPDDAVCDNGLFCDGAEFCDAIEGCRSGAAPDCDDGFDCTVDSCDEKGDICLNTPDDLLCDDGLFCNGLEACVGGICVSGSIPCDTGSGCCDEELDVCLTSELVASLPAVDGTLWRAHRNRMRLTFPAPEQVPALGKVQVRALLAGGLFGADVAGGFDFVMDGSDLVLIDAGAPSLDNQMWYKVSWCAALEQGTCCSADFLVQAGDANNDGMVNFADLNEAFKSVPTLPSGMDESKIRRDINGDGFINFADLKAADAFIPGDFVPKPDGH